MVANMPATTVAISASAASVGSLRLRGRAWTKAEGTSLSTINRPKAARAAIGRSVAWSAAGPKAPMKILIVDDEPGTRLMVATAVEHLGHRALQASDGDEGWAASSASGPRS